MSFFQASSQHCPGPIDHAGLRLLPDHLPLEAAFDRSRTIPFIVKRLIDFAGASLGLLLLTPVFILIALIIRLESRGSVFFRQERMGHKGKVFRIWKFRTMCDGAESKLVDLEPFNESPGGVLFKLRRDPRITSVGNILRRTSLDELPQLINVLMGQMSLVGPRPLPMRDCVRLMALDQHGYKKRHQVLPGITCLWQVSGRSRLGADRMIELDCHYIENWSLWFDLRILVQTFAVVLIDRGGTC